MIGNMVLTALYQGFTTVWFMGYTVLLSLRWLRADQEGYREGLARLGLVQESTLPQHPTLVYAEGVGECRAALPWLRAMQKNTDHQVVVVVLDKEAKVMMEKIGRGFPVVLLPWDIKAPMRWFLTKLNPKGVIVIERGIWPNFFCAIEQMKIPCMVASARLSERSFRFYQGLGKTFQHLVRPVAFWGAQSEAIRQQYMKLGVCEKKIQTLGNIKYALDGLSETECQQAKAIRKQWLGDGPGLIWVAVSTHEGEEGALLESYKLLQTRVPNSKLVIIPRFIDRAEGIQKLVEKNNLQATRYSQQGVSSLVPIHIVDAIGQVMPFLAMADVSFIGGSLVERGGHNPLESVKLGVPCLTGPHTKNFTSVWQDLAKIGAHRVVKKPQDIVRQIEGWFQDKQEKQRLSKRLEDYMREQDAVLVKHIESWQRVCASETV